MWRRTALAAGVLVLGAGACSLIAGLDGLDFDGGAACSASMPCPSQGPCVVTSCNAAGTCESKPLQDGTLTPRPLHMPGGCVTAVCGGIPSPPRGPPASRARRTRAPVSATAWARAWAA